MNASEVINNKENVIEDDDDVPKLSAETLKALQEFYAETELIENKADINENWVIIQLTFGLINSKFQVNLKSSN